jgi:hypothetical protein
MSLASFAPRNDTKKGVIASEAKQSRGQRHRRIWIWPDTHLTKVS